MQHFLMVAFTLRIYVQFRATALFSFQRRGCSIWNGRGVHQRRRIHPYESQMEEKTYLYPDIPVGVLLDSISPTECKVQFNAQDGMIKNVDLIWYFESSHEMDYDALEAAMIDDSGVGLKDYKFFCFNKA